MPRSAAASCLPASDGTLAPVYTTEERGLLLCPLPLSFAGAVLYVPALLRGTAMAFAVKPRHRCWTKLWQNSTQRPFKPFYNDSGLVNVKAFAFFEAKTGKRGRRLESRHGRLIAHCVVFASSCYTISILFSLSLL